MQACSHARHTPHGEGKQYWGYIYVPCHRMQSLCPDQSSTCSCSSLSGPSTPQAAQVCPWHCAVQPVQPCHNKLLSNSWQLGNDCCLKRSITYRNSRNRSVLLVLQRDFSQNRVGHNKGGIGSATSKNGLIFVILVPLRFTPSLC